MVFRPIDDDAEHHRVLFELGLLDDQEDWPLFQQMQAAQLSFDRAIPDEYWLEYVLTMKKRPWEGAF